MIAMRCLLPVLVLWSLCVPRFFGQTPAVDFTRDVAPVFRKNCYGCHGPSLQTSGFRLDDPVAALKGGYTGPSILPGKAAQSPLIQRISAAKGFPVMPPAGKRLSPEEIDIIRRWIDSGAHHSAEAPANPSVPASPAGAEVQASPLEFPPDCGTHTAPGSRFSVGPQSH